MRDSAAVAADLDACRCLGAGSSAMSPCCATGSANAPCGCVTGRPADPARCSPQRHPRPDPRSRHRAANADPYRTVIPPSDPERQQTSGISSRSRPPRSSCMLDSPDTQPGPGDRERFWERWRTVIVGDLLFAVVFGGVLSVALALVTNHLEDERSERAERLENLRFVRTLSGEGDRDRPLNGIDLAGQNVFGLELPGAQFDSANLSGARLALSDLTEADFSGADLSGADLRGATLSGADFQGADLSDAYLGGANLSGAKLGRPTSPVPTFTMRTSVTPTLTSTPTCPAPTSVTPTSAAQIWQMPSLRTPLMVPSCGTATRYGPKASRPRHPAPPLHLTQPQGPDQRTLGTKRRCEHRLPTLAQNLIARLIGTAGAHGHIAPVHVRAHVIPSPTGAPRLDRLKTPSKSRAPVPRTRTPTGPSPPPSNPKRR